MVTVTTIIPTYDRVDLLVGRALPSVLAQTVDDWECIVVGDGAGPETEAAMAAVDDPRVEFINIPRPEYPADPLEYWRVAGVDAINAGIDRARGAWISILADDDAYMPCHHQRLLEASAGVQLVWGQSSCYVRGRRRDIIYGARRQLVTDDVCVGAFLCRADVMPRPSRVRSRPWSWDAEWWQQLIAANIPHRQVTAIVHEYHPNPANWAHHGFAG